VDYRGQSCTVYPVSWDGVETHPTDSARLASERAFQGALMTGLRRAGLQPRPPEDGLPDQPIVVTSYVKRADAGGRVVRWLAWPGVTGAFDVAGEVGDATSLFGRFGAGKARMNVWFGLDLFGWHNRDADVVLSEAAKVSGERAAAQIVAVLAAR